MLIIETSPILRKELKRGRESGKRIAFIATMGNLHEGHLCMVKEAKAQADLVVVSIFVNPLQFNNATDLEKYPRTLQSDCEKLNKAQVDIVFAPSVDEIYPNGLSSQTYVTVPHLSDILEGAKRPGHFQGVATVISKLFNLIQPDIAFFGEKDYQQLQLIRKLVDDMAYDIAIAAVPTIRAQSGLAYSSRNSLLSDEEKLIAPKLYQIMQTMADELRANQKSVEDIINNATNSLIAENFATDEMAIRDAQTLEPLNENSQRAIILIAAVLGQVRLTDSLQIELSLTA